MNVLTVSNWLLFNMNFIDFMLIVFIKINVWLLFFILNYIFFILSDD